MFLTSADAFGPSERRVVMKNFTSKLRKFLVSEDGPTAVEYAVMLSLIIAVCLAAITTIGNNAASVFSKVANSI
jgi:pilus assembly protein Flp/PilA